MAINDVDLEHLIWGIYGQAYVVLGVSLAARAAVFPTSPLRNRLFCLAAFSLIHAVYVSVFSAGTITTELLFAKIRLGIQALSFFSLAYFAFGWRKGHGALLHSVAIATVCVWLLLALWVTSPAPLEALTRLGIGVPAAFCAALALARDPVFRPIPSAPVWVFRVAAASLAAYAFMQLFLTPATFFPHSVFNTDNFQAVLGVSATILRGGLAAIFMVSTFALLHRFDAAMRHAATSLAQHAHNALRISEARLSDIARMSPEAIIVTDETGCITMFSAGAQAIFGYAEGEMIGYGIDSLLPERFRASHPFRAVGSAASPPQDIVGMEIVGIRRNGEEFPMEASLSTLSMPDGTTLTTILRDTSHQKAVHDELLNAKLRAEEANKAKSTFIANMSHELRTPLNAILGFSELLGTAGYSSRSEEYGKIIHQSGHLLLALINDILDLAKIESGRLQLRETMMDVALLIGDCVELMAVKAKIGHVALISDISKTLPLISGDERALTQILLNLLSNAVKFTPAQGTVVAFARVEANGELALGVRDTGIGIAEEDRERVFDNFGQGRHDAVTTDKGTGLGLSIVRGLANAHGGRVELQSTLSVGTCVTVYLPASRLQLRVA